MVTRAVIASEAVRAAHRLGWPLFVGTGFLCREVMSLTAPGTLPVLPLQGGMGLAAGVAAGYALGQRETGAVVLEGDGSHLMGWGSAQFTGHCGARVLHLVSCNGVYQSTGGQQLPHTTGQTQLRAAVVALNYEHGLRATTGDELGRIVDNAAAWPLPCLVYVTEDPTDEVPSRQDLPTAVYTRHLIRDRQNRSLTPAIAVSGEESGDARRH